MQAYAAINLTIVERLHFQQKNVLTYSKEKYSNKETSAKMSYFIKMKIPRKLHQSVRVSNSKPHQSGDLGVGRDCRGFGGSSYA